MGNLTDYIEQYGYIVLFGALLLELIAFPIPGEVLMTYSGFLVFQHELNWAYSILVAGAGTSLGMTISYYIGCKLGTPFFIKYGQYFHMSPEKIEKTSRWFNTHGNKLLIIAYFIPGVRHITGYFSGIIQIPFRTYALYAYSGAFLWVSIFITFGKILGPQWEQFHMAIKKYLLIIGCIAAVILVLMYVRNKYKQKIKAYAIWQLKIALYFLHSRRKVGVILITAVVTIFSLFLLMIGLIQDFLGNEFQDFNDITGLFLHFAFNDKWIPVMKLFSFMGSRNTLIALLIVTVVWTFLKGQDTFRRLALVAIVVCGGEVYEEFLRRLFYNFSPLKQSLTNPLYSFPNEQSLLTVVVFGISIFTVIWTINSISVRRFLSIATLILLVLIAISRMYLEVQLPSNILAGYVFGSVWLGFTVFVFEVLHLLKNLDFDYNSFEKKL
ncbi:phosphatase PAP2 family protein [Planococcus sp. ANT_H30]|uniref:VTT domain-containing protein n=1 Tax=Planococcus sp. ANT_H30 TaxID=2597347 RepID=UPI0011ECF99F|nr:VTT domain-containing protein [Planococcus sp. ANT_H30]KAA0956384.1 phosphatase PAP2 family protein [Planococcus sp. ANT_H30]